MKQCCKKGGWIFKGKDVNPSKVLEKRTYFQINSPDSFDLIEKQDYGDGNGFVNVETHLTTLGARFALNPRLQLSAFYQYNSFDEQGRWNIRGSWEYRPLSFIYFVFNDTQIDGLDMDFREQQVISKVTFIRQF